MAFMKQTLASENESTSIPNEFIDKYMPNASPLFVIVYIYSVRHYFNNNNNLTMKETADSLGVYQSEVKKAWEYWAEIGIVNIQTSDEFPEDLLIEFLPFEQVNHKAKEKDIKVNMSIQPAYTTEEINIYMERSDEIRQLFKQTEKIFAKPLTHNELNMVLTFFEWYALPIDVIEVMLEYCVSMDKKGKSYLEVVARDWSDNEIKTVEKAHEYIGTFSEYGKIMKCFGLNGKSPNKKQIGFMKKWLEEYKLPLDIIIEGCEDSFGQTGKPQFEYAEQILQNWSINQVKTIDDIDRVKKEFKEANAATKTLKSTAKTTKATYNNRFINYKQRDWDFDKIEKLAQEKLWNN